MAGCIVPQARWYYCTEVALAPHCRFLQPLTLGPVAGRQGSAVLAATDTLNRDLIPRQRSP